MLSTRNFAISSKIAPFFVKRDASSKVKRICVVGSGPGGFYASQYILKHLSDSCVDIIEKFPVPFGLIRFGVAPDHPEVKNVVNTFSKIAENPRLRFLGNVCLGKDIAISELREKYHAVLLAYGAEEDRKLNIVNEQYSNVLSAREFVAWYNGLPGVENLNPNLSSNTVAVIGQGNVAIDVARILLSPIDKLKFTDITAHALEALSTSKVKKVYLIGRRGPLQAAFTIKELREILTLSQTKTIWRPTDFIGISEAVTKLQRPRKRLTELMLNSIESKKLEESTAQKLFLPIFLRSPKAVFSDHLELTVNSMLGDGAVPTVESEKLCANLILRSIGYRSINVDPDLNFDSQAGRVANVSGRMLKKGSLTEFETGIYVSGWLATGPTGVILTTMNTSFALADIICQDLKKNQTCFNVSKEGITSKDKRIVDWSGWKRIDKYEISQGKKHGKLREKITSIEKMLQVAGL